MANEKQKAPSMAELLAQIAAMQEQLTAANAAAEQARKEAELAKAAAAASKKAGRAPKTHEEMMASSAWYRMGWAIKAVDPAITAASDSYGRASGRALAVMFDGDPGNLAGGNIRQYAARSANVIAGFLAAEANTASQDTIRRYQALLAEFAKYATDASLTAAQIEAAKQAGLAAANEQEQAEVAE